MPHMHGGRGDCLAQTDQSINNKKTLFLKRHSLHKGGGEIDLKNVHISNFSSHSCHRRRKIAHVTDAACHRISRAGSFFGAFHILTFSFWRFHFLTFSFFDVMRHHLHILNVNLRDHRVRIRRGVRHGPRRVLRPEERRRGRSPEVGLNENCHEKRKKKQCGKKRVSNWYVVTSGTTFLCVEVNQKLPRKRATLKLSTPFPNKNERFFVNSKINCFKVFTEEVLSFLKPFRPSPEERKKVNFCKEPQRRPHPIINFPSRQNCHSLRAFSQFWEQGRITGG